MDKTTQIGVENQLWPKVFLVLAHLLSWVVLLTSPFCQPLWNERAPDKVKVTILIFTAVLLLVSYLNYFVFIPKWLLKKKFLLYFLFLLGSAVVLYFVHHFFNTGPQKGTPPGFLKGPPPPGVMRFDRTPNFPIIAVSWIILITTLVRIFKNWVQQDRIRQQLSQEQLKTELNFLKNQISPHFFFNSLNTIYSLTETDGKKAREVTHKLSKLMRYLVYDTEKSAELPLKNELTFLEHYIDLARMRVPENVEVVFEKEIKNDLVLVPPLVFLTFVENAFKHGITTQEKCEIRFRFMQDEQKLVFESSNTIPVFKTEKEVGGVGMVNVKRRLELLYPEDGFSLEYGAQGKEYKVKLVINYVN